MTAPLVLFTYALVVAVLGGRWMSGARWTQRSPALGILAWQSLTVSVVLALVLSGLALALPTLPFTTNLADLLHSCATALKGHYATPGGAAVASGGAVLALAVSGRLAYCVAASLSRARRHATSQRRTLHLVARRDTGTGVLIIEHATPAVYCLPGAPQEVVVTTAALATLNADEITAVLAHERAHLSRRHWLVLAGAGALQESFPFLPIFGLARAQVAGLVEMHADDAALPASERRVLAGALITLAGGAAPEGALSAGQESALARVRRLARPARPLGMARSVLVVTVALSSVIVPFVIAGLPSAFAAALHLCPLGLTR